MKLHIPPRMWPLLGRRRGLKSPSKKHQQENFEEVLFEEAFFAAEQPTVPLNAMSTASRPRGLPRSLSRAQKLPEAARRAATQEKYYSLLMSSGTHEEGIDAAQTRNHQGTTLVLKQSIKGSASSSQRSQKPLRNWSPSSSLLVSSPTRGPPAMSNWAPSPNSTLDMARSSVSQTSEYTKDRTLPSTSPQHRPCWLCRSLGATGKGCAWAGGGGCHKLAEPTALNIATIETPRSPRKSEAVHPETDVNEPANEMLTSMQTLMLTSPALETTRPSLRDRDMLKVSEEDVGVVGQELSLIKRKRFRGVNKKVQLPDPRLNIQKVKKGGPRKCDFMEITADPHKILYGQEVIIDHFENGQPLQKAIEDIKKGTLSADQLPPIRVAKLSGIMGNMVSIDQRRLYVLKQALSPEQQVNVRIIQSDWLIQKLEKSLPEGCFGYETLEVQEAPPEFFEKCRKKNEAENEGGPEPWTE